MSVIVVALNQALVVPAIVNPDVIVVLREENEDQGDHQDVQEKEVHKDVREILEEEVLVGDKDQEETLEEGVLVEEGVQPDQGDQGVQGVREIN